MADAQKKMDPELKAEWVAALRSGEYKQAREALHTTTVDGHAYCCLGVLCKLVPGVEFTPDDAFYRDADGETHDADGGLPYPVREIAGIDAKAVIELVGMNDGKGVPACSFLEIADYIEANL